MTTPYETLAQAKYVSLETFRRDGRGVRTPIWVGGRDGKLYAFSLANAGKVKRIRNGGRVRMAPCTFRGRITGDWVEGQAKVVRRELEAAEARALLRGKYGFFGWIAFTLGAAKDRAGKRAYIEITLA